jgi:hypothetical protein
MHSDDRQKLVALIAGVLLAPQFDPAIAEQETDLDKDPRIRGALRAARTICDAVEDLETRSEAVVFDPPQDVEKVVGMPFRGEQHLRKGGRE